MANDPSDPHFDGFSQSCKPRPERRGSPRIPWRVGFSAAGVEGSGLLQDLSLSGTLVVAPGIGPEAGRMVKLLFSSRDEGRPIEVIGQVTRRSEAGFAVRFSEVDARLRGYLVASGMGMVHFNDPDGAVALAPVEDPKRDSSSSPPTGSIEPAELAEPVESVVAYDPRPAQESPKGEEDGMVIFPGYLSETEVA